MEHTKTMKNVYETKKTDQYFFNNMLNMCRACGATEVPLNFSNMKRKFMFFTNMMSFAFPDLEINKTYTLKYNLCKTCAKKLFDTVDFKSSILKIENKFKKMCKTGRFLVQDHDYSKISTVHSNSKELPENTLGNIVDVLNLDGNIESITVLDDDIINLNTEENLHNVPTTSNPEIMQDVLSEHQLNLISDTTIKSASETSKMQLTKKNNTPPLVLTNANENLVSQITNNESKMPIVYANTNEISEKTIRNIVELIKFDSDIKTISIKKVSTNDLTENTPDLSVQPDLNFKQKINENVMSKTPDKKKIIKYLITVNDSHLDAKENIKEKKSSKKDAKKKLKILHEMNRKENLNSLKINNKNKKATERKQFKDKIKTVLTNTIDLTQSNSDIVQEINKVENKIPKAVNIKSNTSDKPRPKMLDKAGTNENLSLENINNENQPICLEDSPYDNLNSVENVSKKSKIENSDTKLSILLNDESGPVTKLNNFIEQNKIKFTVRNSTGKEANTKDYVNKLAQTFLKTNENIKSLCSETNKIIYNFKYLNDDISNDSETMDIFKTGDMLEVDDPLKEEPLLTEESVEPVYLRINDLKEKNIAEEHIQLKETINTIHDDHDYCKTKKVFVARRILPSDEIKYPWTCAHCPSRFKTYTRQIVHEKKCSKLKKQIHENSDSECPYLCSKCSRSFPTLHYLNMHEDLHEKNMKLTKKMEKAIGLLENLKEKPSFTCEICQKKFLTSYQIELHTNKIHREVKPYECEKCKKAFYTRKACNSHVRNTHAKPTADHMCEQCGQVFRGAYTLKHHVNMNHMPVVLVPCQYCKLPVNKFILKKHLLTHMPKQFMCEICSRRFQSSNCLRQHQRKFHSGDKVKTVRKQRMCCGQLLENNVQYRSHMIVNHPENMFTCTVCGSKHTTSASVQTHKYNVHKDLCIYKCDFCNLEFEKRKYLIAHKKTDHSRTSAINSQKYQCRYCSKTFTLSRYRLRHERRHSIVKPYKCTVCNRAFHFPDQLKNHFVIHSGERPYQCSHCKKQFAHTSNYYKHKKVCPLNRSGNSKSIAPTASVKKTSAKVKRTSTSVIRTSINGKEQLVYPQQSVIFFN